MTDLAPGSYDLALDCVIVGDVVCEITARGTLMGWCAELLEGLAAATRFRPLMRRTSLPDTRGGDGLARRSIGFQFKPSRIACESYVAALPVMSSMHRGYVISMKSDFRIDNQPEIYDRLRLGAQKLNSDMSENTQNQTTDLIDLTGDIVAAYVSNNSVPTADLPGLITGIYNALSGLALASTHQAPAEVAEKPSATQIRKSVTPDGIVSFVDGKTYKIMKRHLTMNGLDPQGYRQRFGLPADYPMVAPSYAAQRSALAKSIGLGRIANREEDEQPRAQGRKKAA